MEADILNEFVEESREHLSSIELQLVSIEAQGADIDDDLVNTVFRAIHSIKGAAGFLGLTSINRLAHSLENVLGKVRDKALIPDPYNVDVMLKGADLLSNMIEDVESSNEMDPQELCDRLDAIFNGGDGAAEVEQRVSEDLDEVAEKVESANADPAPAEQDAEQTNQGDAEQAAPAPAPQPAAATPAPAATPASKAPAAAKKPEAEKKSGSDGRQSADATIRVSVRVLDKLMNLAGELVLARNQLLRSVSESSTGSAITQIASGLDHVTTELQESIMQTRMQPIGNVFNKFPRIIRDLSSSLGKEIALKIEGAEVETDKTIVEAIADPLTHLVRNSCDHGVERPEDRLAAGKEAGGNVRLRAFHQAGKVMIEIIDDGRGMDPAKLKEKALEKGVLTEEAASKMSDQDAVNLIFAPGFSTAEKITDVSGRGVGMDVVRTNIEKIGGAVEVESKLGEGSTIRITLPLTLAIVPSMIVSVGDRAYALPQVNIVELVQTGGTEKQIETVNNVEVLRLRGELLPLVRLQELLDIEREESKNEQQLVVVETGRNRLAIAVDRVLDSEEIVVKPLGKNLSTLPLFAGSTILGDGRVAMILDVSGITSKLQLSVDGDGPLHEKDEQAIEEKDLQRLVLLSTSEKDRFAVSMDVVQRIERVAINEIENLGDYRVLQYRNGTLPLLSIDDVLEVSEVEQNDYLHVIVFAVYGREVGLIAPRLDDIVEGDLRMSDTSGDTPGLAGVAILEGHTTRILDLYGVTEAARPEWFKKPEHENEREGEYKSFHILVNEDSKFFRNFLVKTLKEDGHTVDSFEDGELGWDHLNTTKLKYDLILTDIEMPNMNGFGFTKRVREDERFKDMSIIALTSLADSESRTKGRDVGVTDYQIKMNKPELLSAIQRLGGKTHVPLTIDA